MNIPYILSACGLIVLVILGICLVRALNFNPPKGQGHSENKRSLDEKPYLEDLAISRFRSLLKIPTISYYDSNRIDQKAFSDFKIKLKDLYPQIYETCTFEQVGPTGLLFKWEGKSSKDPTVLMSHYDVVPVNENLWTKAPFSADLENGYIWARGTLDTKGTLVAILEAVEAHIKNGFQPDTDIYLSFSGDEEISGPSAPAVVEWLRDKGIEPGLVLDEGGAVVEDVFPGVKGQCALIGIGEKGYMDVEMSLIGQGGHASAPPSKTPVGRLGTAASRIEGNPFKGHFTEPVVEMFDTLGRHSSFAYKIVFSNMWLFKPLLNKMFQSKGGQLNALIRTTCALTKMEGSKAFNVLPPEARIGMNLRLLRNDSPESALMHLKTTARDEDIVFHVIESRPASPYADTKGPSFNRVKASVKTIWPESIVSPYLMVAASDSRHFSTLTPNVLKFSAMQLSNEEIGLIHSNDERISVERWLEAVDFFYDLIGRS